MNNTTIGPAIINGLENKGPLVVGNYETIDNSAAAENQGAVSECHSRCSIQGIEFIGGLIGLNGGTNASVGGSQAYGQVTGSERAGRSINPRVYCSACREISRRW